MHDWLILYDDGKTPQIHSITIAAPLMRDAIAKLLMLEPDVTAECIWACVLENHAGTACRLIPIAMRQAMLQRLETALLRF